MPRPKIKLQKSTPQKAVDFLSIFLVVVCVLLIWFFQDGLPDKVPLYFNWPSKDANGLGAKELLWNVPLITGILVIGMLFLNRSPWLMNYPVQITEENAERNYALSTNLVRAITLAIAAIGCLITLSSILAGLGSEFAFGAYLMPAIPIVMLGIFVFFLLKLIRLN
jgi:hypothetical protein